MRKHIAQNRKDTYVPGFRRGRPIKIKQSRTRHFSRSFPLPTEPGEYYWTEWKALVTLYKKKGGRHLYVVPPGDDRVEVRVSPAIAGDFIKATRTS